MREAPAGSGFAAGDRVMAVTMLGGFAEVAVAAAGADVPLPEQLSFEQGAGFILNYHTAHFALSQARGGAARGETVVVHGAAGGVGTAAIQVARGLGAEVVAVTSSAEKADVARRAGAHARGRQRRRLGRRAPRYQRRQGRRRDRRPRRRRPFR